MYTIDNTYRLFPLCPAATLGAFLLRAGVTNRVVLGGAMIVYKRVGTIDAEVLATQLIAARKAINKSGREIGHTIGVSHSFYYALELGTIRSIDAALLDKLNQILDIQIEIDSKD